MRRTMLNCNKLRGTHLLLLAAVSVLLTAGFPSHPWRNNCTRKHSHRRKMQVTPSLRRLEE